ncbi:stress-response A/B barrel domain-containing protein UP3 [Phalaenopsis equestris]|uniref:stress-response A/B barrel domain-containing protein UP3 n=1 Tax=Phalaenopsis equestris TaxID=78828 RepID=UPI0009E47226|nr:stress-response A/B barrel domain-containing protein UP3 [Phalaenopsis equestris]
MPGNTAPVDVFMKRRKIVEHIILLQAKVDLSDIDEKYMLDFMYTSQYHMSGIIALSLGRVEDSNVDNITHAVFMRFQNREDLARFSANPRFLEVLKEHVFPYCDGSLSMAFESKVEDDMLSLFRRGEEFNYGVECVLLISVFEASLGHAIEEAMLAFQNLMDEFRSLIVQGTIGSTFSNGDSEYTHAAIIRFYDFEAFDMFRCSSKYKNIWESKFQSITRKSLLIHFHVDPVGTELL